MSMPSCAYTHNVAMVMDLWLSVSAVIDVEASADAPETPNSSTS